MSRDMIPTEFCSHLRGILNEWPEIQHIQQDIELTRSHPLPKEPLRTQVWRHMEAKG